MKNPITKIAVATLALTTMQVSGDINPAVEVEKKEGGNAVAQSVPASHVAGSDLWNHHGKKLGTVEKVLLTPGKAEVIAVVETSALEENRKILVPWSSLHVRTKENEPDSIIYALDTDMAKLASAPTYTEDKTTREFEFRTAKKYWGILKREGKEAAVELKEKAKDAYEETKDSIKDAVEDLTDDDS